MNVDRASAVLAVSALLAFHAFAADSNASETPTLDFANGLYARQMYGPAASEYEKYLKTQPDSPETPSALYRYADSLYFLKKYPESEAQFRNFTEKYSADRRASSAWLRIGSASFFQDKFPDAIKALTPLTVRASDARVQAAAWFYLAKSWEAAGKPERVAEAYKVVVEKYLDSEYAALAAAALGDLSLKNQDLSSAADYYRIAADAGKPVNVARESGLQAAEIAYGLKDYARAKADYEKLLTVLKWHDDEAAEDKPHAVEVEDKALAGLFHVDLQTGDWASIAARADAEKTRIAQSPERLEILYTSALARAEQKNLDGALQAVEEILADPKLDDELREKTIFKKSEWMALKGNKDASLAEIDKVFALKNVDAARANVEKARVLKALGRKKEAMAAYEAALAGKSSDATKAALYEAALLDLEEKRPDAALKRFEIFATGYPDDPNAERALLQVIQIDLDAGRFRKAALDVRGYIAARPHSPYLDIAYYKSGLALARLKNFRGSASAFDRITKMEPESKLAVEARYGEAVSLESAGRYADSVAAYEALVESYPDHTLTTQAFSRLSYLYIRTGQTDKVAGLYEDLLFNRPNVPIDSDGVFWLLQVLMDRGDYARMTKILDAVPARFPGKDLAHELSFFRGEASMGSGDLSKAIEHYLKAVSLKPDGPYAPHAHLGLGLAHAALGENPLAETHLNLALQDDRDVKISARARFELAGILLREKKIEDAAKAYMFVAILYDDPKYTPTALLKAGECFLAVSQPEEADKAFAELRKRYPDSEAVRKAPARPAGAAS